MTPQYWLRHHPILGLASDRVLAQVAAQIEVRDYETAGRVVRPGDRHEHVFVLNQGSFRISRKNRGEKTEILLGVVAAPAIFGDAELFGGIERWHVSVSATAPASALLIPNPTFEQLAASDARISFALYRDASARHMLTIELMQVFGLQSAAHRILRLLWKISTLDDNGGRWAPLNQQELGRALGLHRKTVARHLDKLESLGLVTRSGRRLLIIATPAQAFGDRPLEAGLGASWTIADSKQQP